MTLLYRLCQLTFRGLAPVLSKERSVQGLENIPHSGPVIFISNHISYWDPTTLLTFVPRQVFFMSKAEMFRYPVLGWLFRALHVVAVERDSPDLDAIHRALAILQRGDQIALYPQGSRSPLLAGQTRRAKGGVLLIAERSRAPIVPVAIAGLETLFMTGFPWIGRPAVSVTFGRPLKFEDLLAQSQLVQDRDKLLDALMAKVMDLLPESGHAIKT